MREVIDKNMILIYAYLFLIGISLLGIYLLCRNTENTSFIIEESIFENSVPVSNYTPPTVIEKPKILQVENICKELSLSKEKVLHYFELCQKNAKLYNLDTNIILAIIFVESHYNEKAESFLGAIHGRGLMQVSEIGLKDYNRVNKTNYVPKDLYNPEINIKVGTWIFYYNLYYGVDNNYADMLSAYNTGIGSWRKNIFNLDYVNKIEKALNLINS